MRIQKGPKTLHDVADEDLEAIEDLHRCDVAATRAGDIEQLKSLMDAQCVVFPPDNDAMDGRAYLDQVRPSLKDEAQPEVLELVQDWQELSVFGDFAYEQGLVRYSMREANGTVTREMQQLMRILRRQVDGAWRVYRAMWHAPRTVTVQPDLTFE